MAAARHVAVIDIGKTNAKVVLVDLEARAEVALRRTPNTVLEDGPYPHYDVERLWHFILESLSALNREAPLAAISVTTHGATAALLDGDGRLALPVLDYEYPGPDELRAEYERLRPGFTESGAPALPAGLNLGAQLYWQEHRFPMEFARTRSILTYPQYWSHRLSAVLASEVTSLGCHTDLWAPLRRDFSSMVDHLGWKHLFPPVRPAGVCLGSLLPVLAVLTGLSPETKIYCGIHDSNASLLPHLMHRRPPFAVVSTGTWVVCMSVGGKALPLDAHRDTLINVNAFGDPVPSARFMGGRENQLLCDGLPDPTAADIASTLAGGLMYLPSAVEGSGPFPDMAGRWTRNSGTPGERRAAVSFYLALMTATCLELSGADGCIVVEGPLVANAEFVDMLRVSTGREVIAETSSTGTSIGAALLAVTSDRDASTESHSPASSPNPRLADYAAAWRQLADGGRGNRGAT